MKIKNRKTKYCDAVSELVCRLGHASNAQLLYELRKSFPKLSSTTVHRITARLEARGELSLAPKTQDGALRYDNNTSEHDHFLCDNCDSLFDANVHTKVADAFSESIEGCEISGRVTVSGICKSCKNGENNE